MDAEPLLHVKRLNSSLYWRPNSYVPIFLTRCYKEFFFFCAAVRYRPGRNNWGNLRLVLVQNIINIISDHNLATGTKTLDTSTWKIYRSKLASFVNQKKKFHDQNRTTLPQNEQNTSI